MDPENAYRNIQKPVDSINIVLGSCVEECWKYSLNTFSNKNGKKNIGLHNLE